MIGLLQRVNWVDILALILLVRITYISSRIGVGKQILPLLLLALILTVSLYNYRIIASFFIERYTFQQAPSLFFSYFFIALLFFVIYYIISRISSFCFLPGEAVPGGIERIGGAILGLFRSTLIIGIILIGLVLLPVKVVGSSVKESYLGLFYVKTSLRIYATFANLIFKGKNISHTTESSKLFSER